MSATPSEFIDNIQRGDDGVWRTTIRSGVSYPDEGHDTCHGVENGSFWFAHRNRCIGAAIRRHPPLASLPFADVGGGNGFVAAMIQDLGYRTVLIEPGASGIAHARERGIGELVQASIVDLVIRPGSLGAIGVFDVIEHIEHDAEALRSLHSMLGEGGRIYATVPAHRWLWSSVDREAGHYRRYTVRQLRELFAASGFDVEFCSYYFWPLPLPMFLLRTLPDWLRLRRGAARRAKRVRTEHRRSGGLLERLLAVEWARFERGRAMPFGASCIIVAARPRSEA